MEPLFFGSGARKLFGAYHEPAGAARSHGVLFAYPGPQEYMYSHYAFRMLAAQLAQAGFPVLRFDWSGTGDSAGDTEAARLADWQQDMLAAEQELRDLARPARISVVGFRLGAAISACTSFRSRLAQLVLWEPVVNGRDYLAELRVIERYKLAWSLDPPSWWNSGSAEELLGHPMGADHRAEINAIDLLGVAPAAAHVQVIVGKAADQHRALVAGLQARGVAADLDEVEGSGTASRGVMLSTLAISRIVGLLRDTP